MINLELYRIFIIVANEGNVTRASEILHISQPAITKQIQNLENQLNIKLFERTNSGMQLTIDGNKLYFKIKDAINLICKTEEEFLKNRVIKVGTRNQILSKIFSKGILKFYDMYPNEKLDIRVDVIDDMLKKLSLGELDIVLTKKIDDINFENLIFISLGFLHEVFVTKYNSKYSKRQFSIDDLKKENIYTNSITGMAVSIRKLKKIFNIDDLNNEKNIKQSHMNVMIEILKNEEVIGFLTREFVQDELEAHKIEVINTSFDIDPTEYGIYYNKNNRFDNLNNFIECIKSECQIYKN